MKKKLVSILLVSVLCFGLTVCGDKADVGSSKKGKNDKVKVEVVYAGNLGDKSYNDSCNAGAAAMFTKSTEVKGVND